MIKREELMVLDMIDERNEEIVLFLQSLIRFKTMTPESDSRVKSLDYKHHQDFIASSLQSPGADLDCGEVDARELEIFPGCGVKGNRDLRGMPVVVGTIIDSGGEEGVYRTTHSVPDIKRLSPG